MDVTAQGAERSHLDNPYVDTVNRGASLLGIERRTGWPPRLEERLITWKDRLHGIYGRSAGCSGPRRRKASIDDTE